MVVVEEEEEGGKGRPVEVLKKQAATSAPHPWLVSAAMLEGSTHKSKVLNERRGSEQERCGIGCWKCK